MYSISNVNLIHFEDQLWTKELLFFQDELAIYGHRLEDLVARSLSKEQMAKVEHFQNQFIREKEVLDQLKRDIKVHEQHLSQLVEEGRTVDEKEADIHGALKERMETFRKIYGELKQEFYGFYASLGQQ